MIDLAAYVLEPLHQEGACILYRGQPQTHTDTNLPALLVVAPVGDHPDTLAPELTAGQEARALLVERLEHVGGKVDHGGLLCHRQAVSGIVVRVCHVASRTVCWVGMPARVNIYVEEACAVVNPGGEEALPSRGGITIRAVRHRGACQPADT